MPLHWLRHKNRQIIRLWQQKGDARLLPLLSAIRVGGLLAAALALWGFAQIADEVLETGLKQITKVSPKNRW
jgi:undecaprenyl-diphosphatase